MVPGLAGHPEVVAVEPQAPRLSSQVLGACLRSAFIEALYDDCSDMLPAEAAAASGPLPQAAE